MDDFQSIAALGIVFITLGIFLTRLLRRKKNANSCGSSCSCEVKDLGKNQAK